MAISDNFKIDYSKNEIRFIDEDDWDKAYGITVVMLHEFLANEMDKHPFDSSDDWELMFG